ncbi:glycosyltransferase family 4 protein [bacterium]|nr:glycosyltransferase family 4 protein [bacterium]
MNKKIILCVNTSWNIINFRAGLVRGLISSGFDVVVAAPRDEYSDMICDLGCRYVEIPMQQNKISLLGEVKLILRLFCLLKSEKPYAYVSFTIKPNIYGSLVSMVLNIKSFVNVAGLGSLFGKDGFVSWVGINLYKVALFNSSKVFFQNDDDMSLFLNKNIVRPDICGVLPGSGVDLKRFVYLPLPNKKIFSFLFIARLLKNKGIYEYVAAARELNKLGLEARYMVVGSVDSSNSNSIGLDELQAWIAEGTIEYLGKSDDVRIQLKQAHCVVLPSFYKEGTPRSLLEAGAIGRPVITTDTAGCRNTVIDGSSGFLCEPESVSDLVAKMIKMHGLPFTEVEKMGERARFHVESNYNEELVIKMYLDALL